MHGIPTNAGGQSPILTPSPVMKKVLCLSFLAVTLVACSAPQGKKYSATNRELPPIAMPPPVAAAEIYGSQQGNIVALTPGGTLTVWLSSVQRGGYGWRLSEVPDPTVLTLVSKEYMPPSATNAGQEKWVFQAVEAGDVDLRLWYTSPRRERFGSSPVFKCVVSVEGELAPMAKGPDTRDSAPVKKSRVGKKAKPKAHRTTPDPETAPFLEPVFRSSAVLLRDQRDGRQKQG